VPVVLAARSLKIPVVIHESDITVGLANKLAIPHCKRVCYVFPETLAQLPAEKAVFAGTPIRAEIFNGSKLKGVQMCGFADNKPVLLVMGGSSGSAAINGILRDALPLLLPKFNIAHICGRGNVDKGLNGTGYRQFEYIGGGVSGGMGDLYALCELVVSRAGSNSLAEFLALNKPNILIPLPRSVSRGDQILNAQSFEKQGFSVVLQEEGLTADTLALAIGSAFDSRGAYRAAMAKSESGANGVEKIVELILEVSRL
jgi:UDP-N-acetylglucosamine--N-acetylmuramyl-(pentapeptide) pyrophosphoryl-undecaprenol N-acetylglucosamine transferase